MTSTATFNVRYFAALAEQSGLSEETLDVGFADMQALYVFLQEKYDFSLSTKQLRVARNQAFCAWSERPQAADEIAFIPPVAGG